MTTDIRISLLGKLVNHEEAQKLLNAHNISQCCLGKQKSAGKHPITGEKLHWKFV